MIWLPIVMLVIFLVVYRKWVYLLLSLLVAFLLVALISGMN
jgi:hypothetical protein